jgi:hypothetical protein
VYSDFPVQLAATSRFPWDGRSGLRRIRSSGSILLRRAGDFLRRRAKVPQRAISVASPVNLWIRSGLGHQLGDTGPGGHQRPAAQVAGHVRPGQERHVVPGVTGLCVGL